MKNKAAIISAIAACALAASAGVLVVRGNMLDSTPATVVVQQEIPAESGTNRTAAQADTTPESKQANPVAAPTAAPAAQSDAATDKTVDAPAPTAKPAAPTAAPTAPTAKPAVSGNSTAALAAPNTSAEAVAGETANVTPSTEAPVEQAPSVKKEETTSDAPAASAHLATPSEIVSSTNVQRQNSGKAEFAVLSELQSAADLRAAEVATSFSHTRPDGTACFTAFPAGYTHMGENIALSHGRVGADYLLNLWMNSAGHRANILSDNYNGMAAGLYYDAASNTTYAVQLFAEQPPKDTPKPAPTEKPTATPAPTAAPTEKPTATPAPVYTYTDTVVAPTCTEAGYTAHKCNETGETTKINETKATGHSFSNGACTVCGENDPDYKPSTSDGGVDCDAYSQEVFRLTNEARVASGLSPLKYCSEYQALADLRAQEASEFYSHTRPNGQPSYSVFDGYNEVQPMGENLIAGYPTPSGAVDAWLSSSGHYANMMNPKADGVIVSTSKLGTENNVTVQIFVQLDSNTGRIETSRDVVAPTCESQGNTIIHYDNNTFEAIDIVPALGHDFANGKCTRCGNNDPDFEYTYTETVNAPTCTELGYTHHACNEDDSKSYDDDYCAPLGHDYVNGQCTRCEEKDPDYTPEYTYTVTVVEPTCDEDGYTHHACNEDGTKSFTDSYTDALGHDYGADGVCTRCGIVNGDDDDGDGGFGYSNNYDKTSFNNTIISDTNAARTQRGHAALRYASEYQAAADVRAQELVSSFSHTRPNGSQPFTALDAIGAKYGVFAENIAIISYMYKPTRFVENWIKSPGHYTSMMADNIDAFVVGTAYDNSHYYAVQIFISDPVSSPAAKMSLEDEELPTIETQATVEPAKEEIPVTVETTVLETPAVEEPLMEEPVAEASPAKEVPALPIEEAPVAEPVEQAPAEQAPVEQAPVEEAPLQETALPQETETVVLPLVEDAEPLPEPSPEAAAAAPVTE